MGIYPAGRDSARLLVCLRGRLQGRGEYTSGTVCALPYRWDRAVVLFSGWADRRDEFQISVLPVVKIISAVFVHLFFVLFIIILYCFYGHFPDLYYLQLFYYTGGLCLLILGLSYMTSSVVIFFRDLSQMISIALQIGVWLTPIMWVAEDKLVSYPWLHRLLKLNPVYYVVTGFRDALIYKHWFWERPLWTLYFWCFTIGALLLGSTVFRRLRVHFADVL